MKFIATVLTGTILLFGSSSFAGGFAIGNGGDVVRCAVDGYYYSLDYLITREQFVKAGKVRMKNVSESLLRIQSLIDQKIPSLSASFLHYRQLLTNTADFTKAYVWKSEDNLPDISDEEYVNYSGCTEAGYKGQFFQAIIREKVSAPNSPAQVVFRFDPEVMKFIATNSLQHSFLLVHEWLWNIAKDAIQNRQINYFLHSKQFELFSPEQIKAYFEKTGVKIN
ncbi:MAG: hypothetical protein H7256_13725 [Bdellovibrio sp.]|nr:hypothetical protein [Bdellovibrio sp.]